MTRPQNRRQFLSDNFSAATTFGVGAAFGGLAHRIALGESRGTQASSSKKSSSLRAVNDETTGVPLLRLPEGFRYRTFGWTGDVMNDGTLTPPVHDGMGVVADDGDILTIVRNHEISEHGTHLRIKGGEPYDVRSKAGCTTLKFDSKHGEWLSSRVSMSGTSRNCAGGVTPWGTWLTAEETTFGPGSVDKYHPDNVVREFKETHGWVFEVPADGCGKPEPIKDMGRFVHEAIAVDRETGIVYETEDRPTSGFYRFLPQTAGKLADGGTLQIAEVVGQKDLRGGFTNGAQFDVRWHTIDNPQWAHTPGTLDEVGVFKQGEAKGASTFSRLEGCWYGNGLVYFDATDGGAAQAGQIWQYDPKSEKLTLLFESPSKPTLNMPDNLCVSPRGGIVLCEDNDYGANEYPQRMFGLSQEGKLAPFAENNVILSGEHNGIAGDFRTKEWAGATFSPDGQWLFVNIQKPGITCAITGPWEDTIL
jgi:secreted PhoX family phosphatase